MKVRDVKTLKGEEYEITFDNGTKVRLFEDVIVNHNLLNREISAELYSQILGENEVAALEVQAIKYIAKKMRSEKEIREYLIDKGATAEMLTRIIDKLKRINLINDLLFAVSYTNDKYNINKYGIYKIIGGLKEHEISDEIISEAVNTITDDEQRIRIRKIVDKYLKDNKRASLVKLKNRIYLNLMDKGYPKELINEVLNNIGDESHKAVRNEYERLSKKYMNKYSDERLKKIIIDKLYQRGFTYDEIKKLEI